MKIINLENIKKLDFILHAITKNNNITDEELLEALTRDVVVEQIKNVVYFIREEKECRNK